MGFGSCWLEDGSTQPSVSNPACSMLLQGPISWITSISCRPIIVSTTVVSHELQTLPTEDSMHDCARRSVQYAEGYCALRLLPVYEMLFVRTIVESQFRQMEWRIDVE